MSQNGKLMPNLDQQSTKMLNLTVLQRIDPFVEEILFTAAHVTFYDFNLDQNQWSRKDVEGSLFVVKRSSQPRFQFIVMNRRNTDNLVENLLGDFEYEVQVPYLLYRNAAQEVTGIWFYNQHECEEVANLFERILNAYSKVPSIPKVHTTNSSEFEELEAVPTSAVIEGPLKPSSSLSTVTDIPDDAFVNFFNSAINMGSNSAGIPLRSNHSTLPPPSSSHNTSAPITTPVLPEASAALPQASTPLMSFFENAESGSNNHAANLLKPMLFAPSPLIVPPLASSTVQATPPVNLSVTLQRPRPYGASLLQPFPPPTPSPALTPAPSYGPIITRDKVRDALVRLAENDQFIDMVYREILNAHSL